MPTDDILLECEEMMEKTTEHLKTEFRGIRTGRASTTLVEHLKVDYYGAPTDLRSIAALSVPESNQIMIKPFSPGDLKAIERAISDSKLGLTPHSDGRALRLTLPALSQERRIQMAAQCKKVAEDSKIALRAHRRDANKLTDTEEKEGTMTEDEVKTCKEQIQELTKTYETKIEDLVDSKQKEIMTV